MRPRIPLPRDWRRHTKAAIVQILALSHYAFTGMLARAANSRNRTTRLRTEIDRLNHELALLQEELRIKDRRMEWLFCFWIAVVLDHFSRRVQGFAVFERKPGSPALRAFLGRAMRRAKATPRHLICDQESMFFCEGFRRWCRRRGLQVRYGAVGKHGSISIIERFFRTMKSEGTRRIQVPFRRDRLRSELKLFMRWYNGHRPHGALEVQTPDEIYTPTRRATMQSQAMAGRESSRPSGS